MSSRERRPIGEDDLQALVDGRLPPDRLAAVEAWLAGQPELAARVEAYRAQREGLRARLQPKAEAPIPQRLRVASILAERRARLRRHLAAAAAAVAWLALGGGLGWYANEALVGSQGSRGVALDALAAHRTFVSEVLHPVEVDAGRQAHLVQWLSKRLGRELRVPDLSARGLRLMGGRLLPAEAGPAAQFMYEDERRQRVTLYVRAGDAGETAFRFVEADGVGAFYWLDRGLSYAVAAPVDRATLQGIAETVHNQLIAAVG